MRHFISLLGLTIFAVILVFGCGKVEEPAKASKPAAKPQAAPVKQEAAKPETPTREQARQETAKLQRYDEPGMPISTDYPDTMTVQGTGSGEGTGFNFRFKPQGTSLDKAEVHIFLPRGAATAAAQEPFVTGPRGLLHNNGWKKEGESTDAGTFPSAWVRKIISFADPGNQGMVGKILLGEAGGQAVQVILYYPGDRTEEFFAHANPILKKLHFKADQLPLKKSQ